MISEFREKIEYYMNRKGAVVIAIEGGAASGKTTLGEQLAAEYSARLFHTDDYFLRPEQRTGERLNEAGGNFDRERFFMEIAKPVFDHKEVLCRAYDCHRRELMEERTVPFKPVTVIEGCYSTHPQLGKYYDISLFLDVDPKEQSARIMERNGASMHKRFLEEWIPKENAYFDAMRIKEKCDFSISVAYLKDWL